MNIHTRMNNQIGLAKTYAKDGAFHTAAKILRDLANEVKSHAEACDDILAQTAVDPVNLAGSGPTPISQRKG